MNKLNISLLSLMILIISCSKNDELLNEKNQTNEMLVFTSFEEFKTTLIKTLEMDINELKAWEADQSFKSFGIACDEVYNSINPDEFENEEALLTFIEANNDYLQIIAEDDGEKELETKYCNSSARYLINEDKMYQVGKNVYKVFNKGVAYTSVNNYEKLKDTDDADFLSLQEKPEFTVSLDSDNIKYKSASINCGTSDEDTDYNGKERLYLQIERIAYYDEPLGVPFGTHFGAKYLIKAQKKSLGMWILAGRTITVKIDITVSWGIGSTRFQDSYTKSDSRIEVPMYSDINAGAAVPLNAAYFTGYLCTAHIPKPCDVIVECK